MIPLEIEAEDPQVITDFVPTVMKEAAAAVFLPGTAWRALDAADNISR